MIPTFIIMVILMAIGFGILYKVVSVYDACFWSSVEQKQKEADEYRWRQGYAFDTLKVPANAYTNMQKVTPKKEVPGYIDLKSFTAVIFTQKHGAYLSRQVKDIQWGSDSIKLTIVFPDALGDTVVEYFIVFNGDGELVSNPNTIKNFPGSITMFPISLRKGDRLQITQTLNLRGQNAKV